MVSAVSKGNLTVDAYIGAIANGPIPWMNDTAVAQARQENFQNGFQFWMKVSLVLSNGDLKHQDRVSRIALPTDHEGPLKAEGQELDQISQSS